jgi:hypothetical protein
MSDCVCCQHDHKEYLAEIGDRWCQQCQKDGCRQPTLKEVGAFVKELMDPELMHKEIKGLLEIIAGKDKEIEALRKTLGQIESAVCLECGGSGEIGLADGEVACPSCYGSGDPTKPGIFRPVTE